MRPLELAWTLLKAYPDARIYDDRFQSRYQAKDGDSAGMRHQTIHPGALAYMRRSGTESPRAEIAGGPAMMNPVGTPEEHYGSMNWMGDVVPNLNRTVMNSVMADNLEYNSQGQHSTPNWTTIGDNYGQSEGLPTSPYEYPKDHGDHKYAPSHYIPTPTMQDHFQAGTPHEAMRRLLDMQQGYNPQEVAGMPAFQESTRPRIGNPDGVQMLPYGNQFIPDFRQQQLEEFANERQQERLADFFYNYSE